MLGVTMYKNHGDDENYTTRFNEQIHELKKRIQDL